MLTLERLKELLHYDPETGVFTWVKTVSNVCAGKRAGSISGLKRRRYRKIKIDRSTYPEHRLAWFYVVGVLPKNQIDHINRNAFDNRFSNLREATNSQNQMNGPLRRNNTSGVRGVYPSKGKWAAKIKKDGYKKHLGTFETIEDAALAYRVAAKALFGSFYAGT